MESAKLKVRSRLTYTPTSLLEGLAMFTVPFAGWEKLLLSFYLLSLILAADLPSIVPLTEMKPTVHQALLADLKMQMMIIQVQFIAVSSHVFPGQSRL